MRTRAAIRVTARLRVSSQTCDVLLSEGACPCGVANQSRRLLIVAEVRPRTLRGEFSKGALLRTQAQCLLHQWLRPLEKRRHACWRAVKGMANSVHAREVLQPLDLLQHYHHDLGVQVEETHRLRVWRWHKICLG